MQNDLLAGGEDSIPPVETIQGRTDLTRAITRGTMRLLDQMGFAPLEEFILPNNRRADLAGLGPKGQLLIIEVKSCREDFQVDSKWQSYEDYCDYFYFAVNETFPTDPLPTGPGLIMADQFGGTVINASLETPVATARRKTLTLSFARQAARKLTRQETNLQN